MYKTLAAFYKLNSPLLVNDIYGCLKLYVSFLLIKKQFASFLFIKKQYVSFLTILEKHISIKAYCDDEPLKRWQIYINSLPLLTMNFKSTGAIIMSADETKTHQDKIKVLQRILNALA